MVRAFMRVSRAELSTLLKALGALKTRGHPPDRMPFLEGTTLDAVTHTLLAWLAVNGSLDTALVQAPQPAALQPVSAEHQDASALEWEARRLSARFANWLDTHRPPLPYAMRSAARDGAFAQSANVQALVAIANAPSPDTHLIEDYCTVLALDIALDSHMASDDPGHIPLGESRQWLHQWLLSEALWTHQDFARAEAIRRNTNGVRDVLLKDLGFEDLDFIDSENSLIVIEIDPIRPDN